MGGLYVDVIYPTSERYGISISYYGDYIRIHETDYNMDGDIVIKGNTIAIHRSEIEQVIEAINTLLKKKEGDA